MSNFQFKEIGHGVIHTTTSGRKCIKLSLDHKKLLNIPIYDMDENIYIFKNERDVEKPYTVMARIDEDDHNAKVFEEMQETERAYWFSKWLFSPEGQKVLKEAQNEIL